jgi:hypothetical protein
LDDSRRVEHGSLDQSVHFCVPSFIIIIIIICRGEPPGTGYPLSRNFIAALKGRKRRPRTGGADAMGCGVTVGRACAVAGELTHARTPIRERRSRPRPLRQQAAASAAFLDGRDALCHSSIPISAWLVSVASRIRGRSSPPGRTAVLFTSAARPRGRKKPKRSARRLLLSEREYVPKLIPTRRLRAPPAFQGLRGARPEAMAIALPRVIVVLRGDGWTRRWP